MHEWIFRVAVVCIAVIAYAINVWLFVAVSIALAGWYGWHRYMHGHVPGADRDLLEQTRRGDLNGALIAGGGMGAAVVAVPIALFALGLGYWVTFAAVALAVLAGGFAYFRHKN